MLKLDYECTASSELAQPSSNRLGRVGVDGIQAAAADERTVVDS